MKIRVNLKKIDVCSNIIMFELYYKSTRHNEYFVCNV